MIQSTEALLQMCLTPDVIQQIEEIFQMCLI